MKESVELRPGDPGSRCWYHIAKLLPTFHAFSTALTYGFPTALGPNFTALHTVSPTDCPHLLASQSLLGQGRAELAS